MTHVTIMELKAKTEILTYRFFRYAELVTLQIDTDKGTAIVLEN